MSASGSWMAAETAEAPQAVARLWAQEGARLRDLGARLRARQPLFVATCARGSSDYAAAYLKYLVEIHLGIPVATLGPSIASIYHAPLRLENSLLVTISQSGQSPDLVALQQAAARAGATTLALVNDPHSPVALSADELIPLHAGVERSVAATKSFISSVSAVAAIVAAWSAHEILGRSLEQLPDALDRALRCDWSAALTTWQGAGSLYALGRGPAFPVAQEMALKSKETAALHAEAFSMAEVMHGPLRLVETGFPILALVPEDQALETNRQALIRLSAASQALFTASPRGGLPGLWLPIPATGHGATDALCAALAFYRFIEQVARLRGHDPDRPPQLRKVTETL